MLRLLFLVLPLLLVGNLCGQVGLDVKMARQQFIPHEAVNLSIQLTNITGSPLSLYGDPQRSWLNIYITNERGEKVLPYNQLDFGRTEIPTGNTVAKPVDLNAYFPIYRLGSYSAHVVVVLPSGEAFQSRSITFNTTYGRTVFESRIGLGEKARDFRLISFAPGNDNYLYFQAEMVKEQQVALTYPISRMLSSKKVEALFDQKSNLNVLFLAAPNRYRHIIIDTRGQVINQEIYTRSPSGQPRLIGFANGDVKIAGGLAFNAKEAQEREAKIKGVSERPTSLY